MVSLYLGTVVGLYLIIFGLTLLFRPHVITDAVRDVLNSRGMSLIIAIVTLILGLLMVVGHNYWVLGWPLLVTLISWLVLMSGILRLVFPQKVAHKSLVFLDHPKRISLTAIVFTIIGIILLICVALTPD